MSLTHIYAHIPGNPWENLSVPNALLSVTPGLVHYTLRGGVHCICLDLNEVALNAASPTSVYSLLDVYSLLEVNGSRLIYVPAQKHERSPSGSRQEPARDLTAARPNCKSRSAPYHTPHGSRRATDRAPDGSLTETGRKIRRTLGVMTPAGVYAEDMPNGRRFKCDLSITGQYFPDDVTVSLRWIMLKRSHARQSATYHKFQDCTCEENIQRNRVRGDASTGVGHERRAQ
ncbi:hypothetical protein Bbelb_031550 [Branchiostoma belcheri]|nr:hypothetical protein Bbelb_031550 [Branchiostoma belcheri]